MVVASGLIPRFQNVSLDNLPESEYYPNKLNEYPGLSSLNPNIKM